MDVPVLRLGSELLNALTAALSEKLRSPLDEIHGKLTSEMIKEWVEGTETLHIPGTKVALRRDRQRQLVVAVVVDNNLNPLSDANGKPISVAFGAKNLAPDLTEIFGSNDIVLLG